MRDGFDARHGGQPMMRAARIIGVVVVVLLTAGCGGTKPAPPGEPAQTAAAQVGGGTAATPTPPATTPSPPPPATSPSPPSPSVATQATPAAVESAEHLATPATPAATAQSATKAGAPAAKTPAKSPAPPAAAAQSPKKDVVQSRADAGSFIAGNATQGNPSDRRDDQARAQESSRRPAGSVPGVLPGEAQDHTGRAPAVVRSADPQGAVSSAGPRSIACRCDRGLARSDLGHSFGSGKVRQFRIHLM